MHFVYKAVCAAFLAEPSYDQFAHSFNSLGPDPYKVTPVSPKPA